MLSWEGGKERKKVKRPHKEYSIRFPHNDTLFIMEKTDSIITIKLKKYYVTS